jgi:hypothetical protein
LAATYTIAFFPIIFFGIIAVVIALVLINSSRHTKYTKTAATSSSQQRRYTFDPSPLYQGYVPGNFNNQMELDMRLPYRSFKKKYPHTNLSYEEYKKMQKQKAFKRSLSSQDNKRMVR